MRSDQLGFATFVLVFTGASFRLFQARWAYLDATAHTGVVRHIASPVLAFACQYHVKVMLQIRIF